MPCAQKISNAIYYKNQRVHTVYICKSDTVYLDYDRSSFSNIVVILDVFVVFILVTSLVSLQTYREKTV